MTEKQKLFQELNDKMVKDLGIKDMEKENIKNEIENFIIYFCGSNQEQKTYLLNCLDEYIDNDHIINE